MDCSEAKSLLKSKTIIGIIAAFLGLLAKKLFGTSIDPATGQELANHLVDGVCLLMQGGGLVLAVIGRVKAKQPLKMPGKGVAASVILAALFMPGLAHASGGMDLINLSLAPMAINLAYALIAFLVINLLWFCVLDKLLLRGFSTAEAIRKGNLAVAQFGGLGFVGLAIMIGLVVG